MLQGKAEGGSGVPLDKDTYEESVAFWDTHAAILVCQKPWRIRWWQFDLVLMLLAIL